MEQQQPGSHNFGSLGPGRSNTNTNGNTNTNNASVNANANATVPPRFDPRNRCQACKSRKVKCSGGPLSCSNCRRLGLSCVFPRSGRDSNRSSPYLVAPTDQLTEAGTVRRRTSAACHECRAHKTKCSGQRPQCGRCARKKLPCGYPQSLALSHDDNLAELATTSDLAETISSDKTLLRRDVLSRHIDAYFVYLYHLPSYNFFHRPSLMQALHDDKIPPVLSAAICAAVSMYKSSSPEDRRLELGWAKEVDKYLFNNLNTLSLLNLQIMILSMLHNYVYRQFGRVWIMMGMASRLALGMQINNQPEDQLDSSPVTDSAGVAARECTRRLAWSLFIRDRFSSAAGVEQFQTMPERWMKIQLPLNEDDFHNERPGLSGMLHDYDMDNPSRPNYELGVGGYIVLVLNLHHDVLQITKSIMSRKEQGTTEEVQAALLPIMGLKDRLEALHASLPEQLQLSSLNDRSIFRQCTSPEFPAYITLHTWIHATGCDILRMCLPDTRETASPEFLAHSPPGFVASGMAFTVSFAASMAMTWKRVLDIKQKGLVTMPGNFIPLAPESCVNVYQCTKILLIARRFQLYTGLFKPFTGEPVTIDQTVVESLCRSNLAFIQDLASVAPIAAVVQRDVSRMIDAEMERPIGVPPPPEEAPPTHSIVQEQNILSRYNLLALATANGDPPPRPASPDRYTIPEEESYTTSTGRNSEADFIQAAAAPPMIPTADPLTATNPANTMTASTSDLIGSTSVNNGVGYTPPIIVGGGGGGGDMDALGSTTCQQPPHHHQHNMYGGPTVIDAQWSQNLLMAQTYPAPESYILSDYTVKASGSDMEGELDWFLRQI